MSGAMLGSNEVGHAHLLRAIPVQEQAVVTRPLYDEGPVRLVLFAMDAEQTLSEHSVAQPALVQVLDGRITFSVAGQDREMSAHDFICLPPGEGHSVRALEPSRFLLTLVGGATS